MFLLLGKMMRLVGGIGWFGLIRWIFICGCVCSVLKLVWLDICGNIGIVMCSVLVEVVCCVVCIVFFVLR